MTPEEFRNLERGNALRRLGITWQVESFFSGIPSWCCVELRAIRQDPPYSIFVHPHLHKWKRWLEQAHKWDLEHNRRLDR